VTSMQVGSASMNANLPPLPGINGQHAIEALRRAIISGELAPGERIRQDEFAESLGISRPGA
jgi:DNA-binding GntR family transcriptional regulator